MLEITERSCRFWMRRRGVCDLLKLNSWLPMKTKFIFLSFLFLNLTSILSQQDSIPLKRDAYVIGFLPSQRANIYGLSLGLIGSEVYCNLTHKRNSHGVNFQLFGNGGFVILTPHFWNQRGFAEDSVFQRIFSESPTIRFDITES